MKPDFRRYRQADLLHVVALLEQVLPSDRPYNQPETSITEKAKADDLMFVGSVTGQLCGFVMAGYYGHRGWIYQLAVLPDFRRNKIGDGLVKEALGALRELGCSKVNLQVRADNTDVIDFYRSEGFEVEDRVSMGLILHQPVRESR